MQRYVKLVTSYSVATALALLSVMLTGRAVAATYYWTGAAADGLWTTAGNWDPEVVPPTSSGTVLIFDDTGVGTTTSLGGQNFGVGGIEFIHAQGTTHTIDLAGGDLIMRGEGSSGALLAAGAVAVAEDKYNVGDVVITNGTLQIGTAGLKGRITVGSTISTTAVDGRGRLFVHGGFCTSNMTSLVLSVVNTGLTRNSTNSVLDLSGTTIESPQGKHHWIMSGNLIIGRQSYSDGLLLLPPTLEKMEIGGYFEMGLAGRFDRTRGCIDFGVGSRLRSLSVAGNFTLGAGGSNELRNWPQSVAVTIGTPQKPVQCIIGYGGSDRGADATLVVSNAPFTAWINDLKLGGGNTSGGNSADDNSLGLLDLEYATTVQIGDTPNAIDISEFNIGYGRFYGSGELRLPKSLKSLAADRFVLGGTRHDSTLLFAAGSQLTNFVVRQSFMQGSAWDTGYPNNGGSGYIRGLPPNVAFQFGTPEAPARFSMGDCYQYGGGGHSLLAPTNGSFTAYLEVLRLGLSRRDAISESGIKATLDLRETELKAFEVRGSAMIGSWTNTVAHFEGNAKGEGRLYLPQGEATIAGSLHVGDSRVDSYGLLDLSGTRVACHDLVEIGKTGRVVIRMRGEPAGLDLTCEAPERKCWRWRPAAKSRLSVKRYPLLLLMTTGACA